ncbi:MAG: hypothetical protein HY236_03610 [Acidobacteria bacterium]|nr:hypothetical protein [Acidobacteriota bacterium]
MLLLRQQIDVQNEQMQKMNARIATLEKLVERLSGSAAAAPAPPTPVAVTVSEGPPLLVSATPPATASIPSGARLHFSGFADATGISRSTYTGAGIATAFGSIPLERAAESQLGEFRGAANHSRFSFQLDTRLAGRDLTTYAEADFLAGTTSNVFAASNSHGLRMRLYWARWGSSNWDLLAPNRVGLSPSPADIMNTMLIDPNYSVGLVWTRQGTLRYTRHWDRFHLAAALENAEPNILDPREVPVDVHGLATRAVPGANLSPDLVVKLAYDAPFAHLEAAAAERTFQVYSAVLGQKDRAGGGALSLAGVIHAGPRIDLVTQNFIAAGGGRYAQGLVPDVVVRPDGRLVRVTTYSVLQGVEMKPTPRLNLYGYYGLVYGRRAAYRTPSGTYIGFGAPNGSTLDNRTVNQATVGFRQILWRTEGSGAISFAVNYSYLVRKLWEPQPAGALGRSHMVYTNVRYNLP